MVTRETEEFMESVEADGDTPKLALIILRRLRAEIDELLEKCEVAAMGWDSCAHDLLHANERIAELESACMQALPELKPCPFCGGKAHVHTDNREMVPAYLIMCFICQARTQLRRSLAEVIAAWHRRAL